LEVHGVCGNKKMLVNMKYYLTLSNTRDFREARYQYFGKIRYTLVCTSTPSLCLLLIIYIRQKLSYHNSQLCHHISDTFTVMCENLACQSFHPEWMEFSGYFGMELYHCLHSWRSHRSWDGKGVYKI